MAERVVEGVRTRDPARRERILSAAAELIARDGYQAVSMAALGGAAGVTGSAVYRHFDSKSAVLVALFDRAVDRLLQDAADLLHATPDLAEALDRLVLQQVDFVVAQRAVAQVYHREVHALPEEDSRRLRRKQRAYVELWVDLLGRLRPGLGEQEARALVHAAIGAIQSSLFQEGMPAARLRPVLEAAGRAVLGVTPPVR